MSGYLSNNGDSEFEMPSSPLKIERHPRSCTNYHKDRTLIQMKEIGKDFSTMEKSIMDYLDT